MLVILSTMAYAEVSHSPSEIRIGNFVNGNYNFPGNVGIGTPTPSTKLHVVGNARITGLVSCDTINSDASGNLVCGTDADTNTQLSESQVDSYVSNNGYLTAEIGDISGIITTSGSSGLNGGCTSGTCSLTFDATDVDGTCLSGSGSVLGLTTNCIGDTQLAYNTGQHLTTASSPTFSGLSLNNKRITSVATPSSGTDAVNKNYVDDQGTGLNNRVVLSNTGTECRLFAGYGPGGGHAPQLHTLNINTLKSSTGTTIPFDDVNFISVLVDPTNPYAIPGVTWYTASYKVSAMVGGQKIVLWSLFHSIESWNDLDHSSFDQGAVFPVPRGTTSLILELDEDANSDPSAGYFLHNSIVLDYAWTTETFT